MDKTAPALMQQATDSVAQGLTLKQANRFCRDSHEWSLFNIFYANALRATGGKLPRAKAPDDMGALQELFSIFAVKK
jgi:hypothetical protein